MINGTFFIDDLKPQVLENQWIGCTFIKELNDNKEQWNYPYRFNSVRT